MKLVYGVKDKPAFLQVLLFAFQQLLAILAATIAVPAIVQNEMSQSAALFGAGVGTLVYQLFTKFRSPVFLGSSFAFIGSMLAAFAGGVSMSVGYFGLILGAAFAGLVYVIIAVVVKIVGVKWINRLMPAAVIGPTVTIIGLSLASNAVKDAVGASDTVKFVEYSTDFSAYIMNPQGWIAFLCAMVTLLTVVLCSVYGKKRLQLIPFIIGILAGYLVATAFTVCGILFRNDTLKIVNFELFKSMQWVPDFSFLRAFDFGSYYFGEGGSLATYIVAIFVAYVPVAFVVFAEHLADHKNLSSIIENDLTEDPGLHRTLLGDGIGSVAGALFGGCPNTTYGESVGCVAITGNASVITITVTAFMAIIASFIAPFVTFLATIPPCVMGGVCVTLYGFIAVSGLKMVQKVDLEDNRNLFVVSVILITGIGDMALRVGQVTITSIAVALILGIVLNLILSRKKKAE